MSINELLDYNIISSKYLNLNVGKVLLVVSIIIITRIILFIIRKVLKKKARRETSFRQSSTIYHLIKYFVWVTSIYITLEIIGVNLTFFIASSAALFVGIGLGLQQIFNDFVSGIVILFEKSIKVYDIIEVDGTVGKVIKVKLRTSIIYTRDGIYLIVPNRKFTNDNIINWSHRSLSTRFQIQVGVSYDSDELLVKKLLLQVAVEHPEVIKNSISNNPYVRIESFGDNGINFELLFWSKAIFQINDIKSELRFSIRKIFKENGIRIPYPQRDLHIIENATKLKKVIN